MSGELRIDAPAFILFYLPGRFSGSSLQDLYGDVVGRDDAAGDVPEPRGKEARKEANGAGRGGRAVQPPVAEQFKVTVSKLQWWTSDADLEELFSPHGKIRKIIFQEEKSTGKSKGVALIQFAEA